MRAEPRLHILPGSSHSLHNSLPLSQPGPQTTPLFGSSLRLLYACLLRQAILVLRLLDLFAHA